MQVSQLACCVGTSCSCQHCVCMGAAMLNMPLTHLPRSATAQMLAYRAGDAPGVVAPVHFKRRNTDSKVLLKQFQTTLPVIAAAYAAWRRTLQEPTLRRRLSVVGARHPAPSRACRTRWAQRSGSISRCLTFCKLAACVLANVTTHLAGSQGSHGKAAGGLGWNSSNVLEQEWVWPLARGCRPTSRLPTPHQL